MPATFNLDELHSNAKTNRWLGYFAVFNRITLAAGFLIAGSVKIIGERFASGLSVNHPMGHYLEALYHTGYYYTYIGIVQIIAAILLLVPRMALLGAIIYFPIILNICVLSFAVRFEGSLLSSPLMLLANLYLLCWDFDKLKLLVSSRTNVAENFKPQKTKRDNKFPILFFSVVFVTIIALVLFVTFSFRVMPRNNMADCEKQFQNTNRSTAGHIFCDCIYNQGMSLDTCLERYRKTPDDVLNQTR